MMLFLQSLEAVAGLHSRGLSHGSLAASNFFLDLHEDGGHRLLLSDFTQVSDESRPRLLCACTMLGQNGIHLRCRLT